MARWHEAGAAGGDVPFPGLPGPGDLQQGAGPRQGDEAVGRAVQVGGGREAVADDLSGRRSRRELPVPPLPRRTGAWMSQDCLLGQG